MTTPTSAPYTDCSPLVKSGAASLSLQLSFVLLGRKNVKRELDTHSQKHVKRLEFIRDVLESCNVEAKVWTPPAFEPKNRPRGHGKSILAVEKEDREEWETWMTEQDTQWKGLVADGGWVLRGVDMEGKMEDGNSIGLLGSWQDGDGVMSEGEKKTFVGSVWYTPFLLQRFGIELHDGETLKREVEHVMHVLNAFSTKKDARGPQFQVVATERCVSHIGFHPPTPTPTTTPTRPGVEPSWSPSTVSNLLLFLTTFEKQLLSLSTPTHVLRFWPLTHYFVHREVEKMKQKKIEMWKKLECGTRTNWGEIVWLRVCKKKVQDWKDELGRVDQGRREKAWWEAVGDMVKEEVIGGEGESVEVVGGAVNDVGSKGMGALVRNMVEFERRGGRLAVSFSVNSVDESAQVDAEDVISAETEPGANDSEPPVPSTPLPPLFPSVNAIALPIPLRTLDTNLVLAHIELLRRLLILATECSCANACIEAQAFMKRLETTDIDALHHLGTLLTLPATQIESLAAYATHPHTTSPPTPSSLSRPTSPATPFAALLKNITKRLDEERQYVPELIERYEQVGGFGVPTQMKVYELMEGEGEVFRGCFGAGGEEEYDEESALDDSDEGVDVWLGKGGERVGVTVRTTAVEPRGRSPLGGRM